MNSNLPPAALAVKKALFMEPIDEGVYIKRLYQSTPDPAGRPAMTMAYALAADAVPSRLHCLDCDELWHFYLGQPLAVYLFGQGRLSTLILGPDLSSGHTPVIVIPAGTIFGACPVQPGGWCLFGCTCTPGFIPAGYTPIQADHPALSPFSAYRQLIWRLAAK
jgi:predicted cupin superfamily sugar epimerase